jgi:divalent metal cation (Fe/Co/Zn/Cd) transporter
MKPRTRRLLAIGVFILGFLMALIGWSVPLTPTWLNTVLFTMGVPLESIAGFYILIRIIMRVAKRGGAE